jgi:hypothetical protein
MPSISCKPNTDQIRENAEAILADIIGLPDATRILTALSEASLIVVPKEPTEEMISAAWASALNEDAPAVWRDMIEEFVCHSK